MFVGIPARFVWLGRLAPAHVFFRSRTSFYASTSMAFCDAATWQNGAEITWYYHKFSCVSLSVWMMWQGKWRLIYLNHPSASASLIKPFIVPKCEDQAASFSAAPGGSLRHWPKPRGRHGLVVTWSWTRSLAVVCCWWFGDNGWPGNFHGKFGSQQTSTFLGDLIVESKQICIGKA